MNGVHAVPCEHPALKDGFFYCTPSFYDSPHMRDSFVFMLVDTNKVIGELQKLNPDLLQHADRKFSGTTASEWVEHNSEDNPMDMGHWGHTPARGLAMSSGQAATITLVKELNLPCFPISISKLTGQVVLDQLRAKFGYDGPEYLRPVGMGRGFNPNEPMP